MARLVGLLEYHRPGAACGAVPTMLQDELDDDRLRPWQASHVLGERVVASVSASQKTEVRQSECLLCLSAFLTAVKIATACPDDERQPQILFGDAFKGPLQVIAGALILSVFCIQCAEFYV